VIAISAFGGGLVIAGFGASHSLWLSMALGAGAGFAQITTLASSNTVLQTIVDDQMRGRLMSFFTMSVMGMAPFGSLLAGVLSSRFGADGTVMIAGAGVALAGLLFSIKLPALRKLVRPIYVAKGIIPEVAGGLRAATTTGEN
jgi:MFS family permease